MLWKILIVFLFIIYVSSAQINPEKYFFSVQNAVGKTAINDLNLSGSAAVCGTAAGTGSFTVAAAPAVFGMKELSPAFVSGIIPLNNQITLNSSICGIYNDLYNEFNANIGASYKFGNFIIGSSVDASSLSVKNYGRDYLLRWNLSGIIKISDDFSAGFNLKNINRAYYPGADKSAGQTLLAGAGYRVDDNLFLDADVLININRYSAFGAAVKYLFTDYLSCRLAFITDPKCIELGCSYLPMSFLKISGDINYQFNTGFSQNFIITFLY